MISKRDKTLLFVYGTLKQGEENRFRLKSSEFIGIAFTDPEYHLFFIDGDSPDVKKDKKDARMIEGELYLVSAVTLKEIDDYEKPYIRHNIKLDDGRKVQAYFYNPRNKGKK